jgi:hypothetical protein
MYYGCMEEKHVMNVGESAEELITAMYSCGFTVTKPELARWHRAGLLLRPQRRSLGRPCGMVSIYPPGTRDQLLALCFIHRSEKRLPYVAWRLWWEGYEVPMNSILPFLEEACEQWQRGIEELQRIQVHPEELAKLLKRSTMMRFSHKTLAQARKRVGRPHFAIFIGVLVRIASGTFKGYVIDPTTGIDERSIVETGFGLQRARTNRLAGAGPWLTGDTGEVLQDLSSRLRHHPFGENLSVAQEAELLESRREVRCFLRSFEEISKTFDLMFSRGAFGFSVLADAVREFGPRDQAAMLLFWRMGRSWGFGPNMDQLLTVARQWQDVWFPLFEGLEQLRREVPATTEVLAPKQMGFALRWKLTMEWVLDMARQLSQETDVKAFFARHPELIEVMETNESELDSQGE